MANEVTFVYLGSPLPRYAVSSLSLAVRYSGLPVHLIASAPPLPHLLEEVRFTLLEEFYDADAFSNASNNVLYSHEMRGGFWLKTLERFFVLGQYMRHFGIQSILHAELDQLLFRVDRLVSHIEALDVTGLFVPRHSEDRAVGSIVYCNSIEKFESMLDFASFTDPFESEMHLIAKWVHNFPEFGHFLPTIYSALGPQSGLAEIQKYGGISDAAQLGQWVAGIDPRNVPLRERPINKFVDQSSPLLVSREKLEGLRFALHDNRSLLVKTAKESEQIVYNLHIHSKIHRHLARKPNGIQELLNAANSDKPVIFPGARRSQVEYHFGNLVRSLPRGVPNVLRRSSRKLSKLARSPMSLVWSIIRQFNLATGRRPSSFPFVSGDTFRAGANHIWETKRIFSAEQVRHGDVIFCESEKAGDQFLQVVKKINARFVLLLGNSDKNHGQNLTELMHKLPSGISIFAQNLVEQVDGVNPLPIGLENAWRVNFGRVGDFKSLRRRLQHKAFRVMWRFSEQTNPSVRVSVADQLSTIAVADLQPYLSPANHRKALARYAFVASPPGNGLDTHRTWEAMYLHCVPIVLRSEMTEQYDSLGLPIWVVDNYKEIEQHDEKSLEEVYIKFLPFFEAEPLWMPYWVKRIEYAQESLITDTSKNWI